jgi:hypothetical protein
MTDAGDDPFGAPLAAEARGRSMMDDAAARILDAVERQAGPWVEGTVRSVIDAWGRLDAAARDGALVQARAAGAAAASRVADELRHLFALDPAAQRSTPLAVVRSLSVEATEVLEAAGVPAVERDEFEVRSFPDDRYGIVPRSLGDLDRADDDLAALLMVWGVGKATVLRARALRHDMTDG